MADVEASVTSARGADVSGWVRSMARDKLALQSSNALSSSGVRVLQNPLHSCLTWVDLHNTLFKNLNDCILTHKV
jgi:hypothetical protein